MNSFDIQHYLNVVRALDPGRYVVPEAFHKRISENFGAKAQAFSEEGRPLILWEWGSGPTRILMWSQMHGNESTGTRALEGLMSVLVDSNDVYISKLWNKVSLRVLPMINPDGAYRWSRRNTFGIDINRDARKQVSAEARFLSQQIIDFKPDYSLNLHDQRTLFRLEQSATPTTLALAIPRVESPNPNAVQGRLRAIRWIERLLSNVNYKNTSSWGLFDEAYYPTAFGEYAQEHGASTVLIESGVSADDYNRMHSVEELFEVILQLLFCSEEDKNTVRQEEEGTLRLALPRNQIGMFDWIDRAAVVHWKGKSIVTDIGWRLVERLVSGTLVYDALLEEMGDLSGIPARQEAAGRLVYLGEDEAPGPGLIRPWRAVSNADSLIR